MTVSRRELFSMFRRAPAAAEPAPVVRGFASRLAPGTRPVPPTMVPRLRPQHCLAARTSCAVCVERCPAPGALRVVGGLPEVVEAACTGCGQCLTVCPAPIMAFDLVARARP